MSAHTPARLLLASGPFPGGLSGERVAAAIARGLEAGGLPEPDLCPIDLVEETTADVRALLDASDFDARMRRARAVVVATAGLHERTLAGSATFEIATRARQSGVPAYAITAENALSAFDARILDLQAILVASGTRGLTAAGGRLAGLV